MKKVITIILLILISISSKAQLDWFMSYPMAETEVRINSYNSDYAYCYYDFNCEVITGEGVSERGICSAESPNPTIALNKIASGSGSGTYTVHPYLLEQKTIYYVRAYAIVPSGVVYSDQVVLTTNTGIGISSVITSLTSTTASIDFSIIDNDNLISRKELIYSVVGNPSGAVILEINNDNTSGTFNLTGLTASTDYQYFVYVYMYNDCGEASTDYVYFTTPSASTIPTVSTKDVLYASSTSATTGGIVSSDGGASITARGVCWNTGGSPTTANSKTINGSGTGSFNSTMSGLSYGTSYYVRAYATNSNGTAYGDEKFYVGAQLPTVSIYATSEVTATSAKASCVIDDRGGAALSDKGIVWSTSTAPTLANSHYSNGSGGLSYEGYESILSGLSPNTTYYIRPYATNIAGTYYGNEVTIYTAENDPPTLSTVPASAISTWAAVSGGFISDSGSTAITAVGVCYATSQNPTTANSTVPHDILQTGGFSSVITGLSQNTTYYVRAYATNSGGTSYGNQISFTTASSCVLPTVTTNYISNVTESSATSGGSITSDGGCSITDKGVCWSTSPNPTISNSHTNDGSGTGSFSSSITGLSCGSTYYVRAYAINSVGVAYGSNVSFSTGSQQNIDNYLYYLVTVTVAGGQVYSGYTLTDAQNMCFYLSDESYLTASSSAYMTIGIPSEGKYVYAISNYCPYLITRYIVWRPDYPARTNTKIIHIVNGLIESITPCP
jgi:hypothetical protein